MKIDYSYHYNKWDHESPEGRRVFRQIHLDLYADHFISDKNAPVLDVGCGTGHLLDTLQSLGFKNVLGIDIDPGQVEIAKQRNLPAQFVSDSRQFLLDHPNTFQQITGFDLIEHIPHSDQLEFVAAITGALAPGGRVILSTPNANSFLAARYRYIDWTHHTSFTEHSLDFLLHSGGLRNIKILPAEKMPKPKLWFIPTGPARFYWAWRVVRLWRRLQFMTELGPDAGRVIPLSANLLAVAFRQ